jgi:hypothetical protein
MAFRAGSGGGKSTWNFYAARAYAGGMNQSLAHVFLQEQPADPAARRRKAVAQDNEPPDEFWPDVSMRYSQDNPVPMKPENAQTRVLFEIFLILAAAASFVGLILLLIPARP